MRADALSRVPLFAELHGAELQAVADAMREGAFRAGEIVTAEGAAGDAFFVIETGEADVSVDGEARGTMVPGDYFGEIALLMGSERTATVAARTDLCCYTLTAADFRTLVEGNPSIAWGVMLSMASRLS